MKIETQDIVFGVVLLLFSFILVCLVLYNYFRKRDFFYNYVLYIYQSSKSIDEQLKNYGEKIKKNVKQEIIKIKKDTVKIKADSQIYTLRLNKLDQKWLLKHDGRDDEIQLSEEYPLDDETTIKIEKKITLGWHIWGPMIITTVFSGVLIILLIIIATSKTKY